MIQDNVDFLNVGKGDFARKIAYRSERRDENKPGIFWLGGFKSSMDGQKAGAIADWAKANGHTATRMDYSGHGFSGGSFRDGTITQWLQEATAVFEKMTRGPQLVIGSSMGGWIALLLAQALFVSDRLSGMILIAPAWDMTEKLMWARFSDDIKDSIEKDGFYARPSAYGDGDYVITRQLIEDGRTHLIGDAGLHIGCPIHILHGGEDPDVPWAHGHELMSLLPRDDVRFTLVPDGDHRLSRDEDIVLLMRIVEAMADEAMAGIEP